MHTQPLNARLLRTNPVITVNYQLFRVRVNKPQPFFGEAYKISPRLAEICCKSRNMLPYFHVDALLATQEIV